MQLSTVFSDGILALCSVIAVVLLWRARRHWCAFWMAGIAVAALIGTLRYAGVESLTTVHNAFSLWAAVVALPSFCWAASCYLRWRRTVRAGESLGLAAALNLILLFPMDAESISVIGGTALAFLFWGALAKFRRQRPLFLMLAWGIGLYAIAGLWIGTTGQFGPVLRIDVYHCALALANILFGVAILRATRQSN